MSTYLKLLQDTPPQWVGLKFYGASPYVMLIMYFTQSTSDSTDTLANISSVRRKSENRCHQPPSSQHHFIFVAVVITTFTSFKLSLPHRPPRHMDNKNFLLQAHALRKPKYVSSANGTFRGPTSVPVGPT